MEAARAGAVGTATEAAPLGAVAMVAAALAARLVERASLCSRRSRYIPSRRSRRRLRPWLGPACSRRPARHKRLGKRRQRFRSLSSSGSPRSAQFASVAGEVRAETVEAGVADEAVDLAARAVAVVTARADADAADAGAAAAARADADAAAAAEADAGSAAAARADADAAAAAEAVTEADAGAAAAARADADAGSAAVARAFVT